MVKPLGLGASLFAIAILVTGGVVVGSSQSARTLEALTVPVTALPAGCALTKPVTTAGPIDVAGAGMVGTNARPWSPRLPNPWVGTDRAIVADVRQAIDPAPRGAPDGPVGPGSDVAFGSKWADDVVEAYHAAYTSAAPSDVEVFAVTFNDAKLATAEPLAEMRRPLSRLADRIVRGPTVIRVSAYTPMEKAAPAAVTACFGAVRDYIDSLK